MSYLYAMLSYSVCFLLGYWCLQMLPNSKSEKILHTLSIKSKKQTNKQTCKQTKKTVEMGFKKRSLSEKWDIKE